jgi:predicted transport protein
MAVSYLRPERLLMKTHPELNERWVQDRIAEDPSIIGLGDLVLREKERTQPRAGRLDLLLQDSETKRRYEVEIQLGATDETHIIRAIEYWDIERKRYPQYDHCGVIIAEDITSRFLNEVSLFNGTIPLIAIQMQVLKISEHITLVFTTVMDELTRGLIDEDEDVAATPTDRAYWESRGTKNTVAIAEHLLEIVRKFDPSIAFKYNKFYIGLAKDGRADNFLTFRPQKRALLLEVRLKQSDDIQNKIDAAGFNTLSYDAKWGNYHLILTADEFKRHSEVLHELIRLAHEGRAG